MHNHIGNYVQKRKSETVGFNALLDTLEVTSETIFPANHLTDANTGSSQPG